MLLRQLPIHNHLRISLCCTKLNSVIWVESSWPVAEFRRGYSNTRSLSAVIHACLKFRGKVERDKGSNILLDTPVNKQLIIKINILKKNINQYILSQRFVHNAVVNNHWTGWISIYVYHLNYSLYITECRIQGYLDFWIHKFKANT